MNRAYKCARARRDTRARRTHGCAYSERGTSRGNTAVRRIRGIPRAKDLSPVYNADPRGEGNLIIGGREEGGEVGGINSEQLSIVARTFSLPSCSPFLLYIVHRSDNFFFTFNDGKAIFEKKKRSHDINGETNTHSKMLSRVF